MWIRGSEQNQWTLLWSCALSSLLVTRSAAAEEAQPKETKRETEPPAVIGPAFDDDSAMATSARRVASYTLHASLDENAHSVRGRGTIAWTNASSRPATELYVHLYLNAFKNDRTVFLRSPFGAGRSGKGAKHWGYVDVQRLAVREMENANLWTPGLARTSDDPDDETDASVPLPRPVAAGETITIDVEWTSQLPEVVERTGYEHDFHLVGQWFPKIARREPDGTWVHFRFNAQSEFYSDFGSYDVTLDVPERMVVGATGVRVEERRNGPRRSERYRIDDVHDFAWTAWPSFDERIESIDGVSVRVLFPRGNERNAEATLRAVRTGLRHYGADYGRYPYRVLTVVHPPVSAPAAGGMEYPTFITTGFPWYTSLATTMVERVTLHELAHQWFYGLVATNEHSWPFLDEGLASFAESSAMKALCGPGDALSLLGLSVDGDAYFRSLAASAGHHDVVARPAADFASFREIGALVYARTETILETLARVYGRNELRRALGRYARRYRFEHPNPKHFTAAVREVLGDDAATALATALFEGGTVDYAVRDLQTASAPKPAGIFEGDKGRQTVQAPEEGAKPDRYVGRALVLRDGTLSFPVDVALTFDDGSATRRRLDGRAKWQWIEVEGKSQLAAVVVDPETKILLDDNLTNNSRRKKPGFSTRVFERIEYFVGLALSVLGP
jgi:hypothetical protein